MNHQTNATPWGHGKRAHSRWVIIAAAMVCLALAAGCSDDPPSKPKPVHYNIYCTANKNFSGEKESRIYIYDADSLTLIDSIPLPNVGDAMAISPDGRSIYQKMWRYKEDYQEYLAKIDVSSRSIVWTAEIPPLEGASEGPVNLLDDGRVLALEGVLYDPETGAIISQHDYRQDRHWSMRWGPVHGTEVVAVQSDLPFTQFQPDTLVIAVDLLTGMKRGAFVPRLAPGQHPLLVYYACLHPDGERVLLLGEYTYGSFFVVGNLTTSELLMAARLSTPSEEITISNDGKLAAVAERASLEWGIGLPAVHVYDIESYKHLGTLDAYQLAYVPGQARFLPGDQRLAVFATLYPGGNDWLQILDVKTVTLGRVIDLPFVDVLGGGFGIGPRPAP